MKYSSHSAIPYTTSSFVKKDIKEKKRKHWSALIELNTNSGNGLLGFRLYRDVVMAT